MTIELSETERTLLAQVVYSQAELNIEGGEDREDTASLLVVLAKIDGEQGKQFFEKYLVKK